MAVDNRFVYGVEVDIAQARRAAAQVKKIFDQSMGEIGVDRKGLLAATAQQKQITAVTKSQTRQREALARTEGQIKVIEARKAAQSAAEIERRKTADHKAELKKRERAERQSGQRITNAQKVKNQVSGIANLAIGGLVAGGSAFAAAEVARQTVEIAKLRTEILRSNVAFETLSGSGADAARNLEAVDRAAGGAVNRLEAQQLATTALTLGLADNAKGIERVVSASKLIATVSPQIRDTAQAVSQLGLAAANQSFVRLDQLGLSASEVRTEIKRLKAANAELTDSEAFLEAALIRVEEKFGDIGESSVTAASGTEELAVAWANLRIAVAESGIGAAADNTIRQLAYGIQLFSGQIEPVQANIDAVTSAMEGLEEANARAWLPGRGAREATIDEMAFLKTQLQNVQSALEQGIPEADKYADKVNLIATVAVGTQRVTEKQVEALQEVSAWFNSASEQAEIFALKQYNLATATSAANAELSAQPEFTSRYTPKAVEARQRYGTSSTGTQGVAYNVESEIRSLAIFSSEQVYEKEKKAAKAAEKEWAKAAKSTARTWGNEITGVLKSVPGLFDSSEVTQEDMNAAAAGRYVEKADEYLRRLRDEVFNGKDYEGVDIRDAAERAGIDPSLPVEEIFRQFEEAWNDSSLFADGLNLDLINADAVQAAIDREKKSGKGEQAILSYFSQLYGPEVAQSIISGGSTGPNVNPAVDGAGGVTDAQGALRVNRIILDRDAIFDTENMPDFAGAFIPALYDSIFDNEQAVADLHLIGGAVAGAIHHGFNAKLPEYNWVSGILSTAQAQAAEQILDSLNAAILPNG